MELLTIDVKLQDEIAEICLSAGNTAKGEGEEYYADCFHEIYRLICKASPLPDGDWLVSEEDRKSLLYSIDEYNEYWGNFGEHDTLRNMFHPIKEKK